MGILDEIMMRNRHNSLDYGYNSQIGYPQAPVYNIDEKTILAEKNPSGLLLMLDKESEREWEYKENKLLTDASNNFAHIYSSKASQEEWDKVNSVSTEFIPEEKNFWGYKTRGKGVVIKIHKD